MDKPPMLCKQVSSDDVYVECNPNYLDLEIKPNHLLLKESINNNFYNASSNNASFNYINDLKYNPKCDKFL